MGLVLLAISVIAGVVFLVRGLLFYRAEYYAGVPIGPRVQGGFELLKISRQAGDPGTTISGFGDVSAVGLSNIDGVLLWIRTPKGVWASTIEAKGALPDGTSSDLNVESSNLPDIVCVQLPAYYPTDTNAVAVDVFNSGKKMGHWLIKDVPPSLRTVKGSTDGKGIAGPVQLASAFWRHKAATRYDLNLQCLIEARLHAKPGELWEIQRDDFINEYMPRRAKSRGQALTTTQIMNGEVQFSTIDRLPMAEMQHYVTANGKVVRYEVKREEVVFKDIKVVADPLHRGNKEWFATDVKKEISAVTPSGAKVTLLPSPKDAGGMDMSGSGPYLSVCYRLETPPPLLKEMGPAHEPLPVTISVADETGTSKSSIGIGTSTSRTVTGRDFAGNALGPKTVTYTPAFIQLAYPQGKAGVLPKLVLTVCRRVDRETYPFSLTGHILEKAPKRPLLPSR